MHVHGDNWRFDAPAVFLPCKPPFKTVGTVESRAASLRLADYGS